MNTESDDDENDEAISVNLNISRQWLRLPKPKTKPESESEIIIIEDKSEPTLTSKKQNFNLESVIFVLSLLCLISSILLLRWFI